MSSTQAENPDQPADNQDQEKPELEKAGQASPDHAETGAAGNGAETSAEEAAKTEPDQTSGDEKEEGEEAAAERPVSSDPSAEAGPGERPDMAVAPNAPPEPGAPEETPLTPEEQGEAAISAIETQMDLVSAQFPVIPPLEASKVVTFLVIATLTILAWLGQSQLVNLKTPELANFGTVGTPITDFSRGWSHVVRTDDVTVAFNSFGHISSAATTRTESGKATDFKTIIQKSALVLRLSDGDGSMRRGRRVKVRTLKNGIVTRSEFLDGAVVCRSQMTIGESESGVQGRYVDFVFELEHVDDDTIRFNYEVQGIDGFLTPTAEIINPLMQGHVTKIFVDENGATSTESDAVDQSTAEHSFSKDNVVGLAVTNQRSVVSLVNMNVQPGYRYQGFYTNRFEEGEFDYETRKTGPSGIATELRLSCNAIEMNGKSKIKQHYRLFFGPRSTWTVLPQATPHAVEMVNGNILRTVIEFYCRVVRGFCRILPSPGLAVLCLGFLLVMAVRPLQLRAEWAVTRGSSIQELSNYFQMLQDQNEELVTVKDQKQKLKKLVSSRKKGLFKEHSIYSGIGCLLWIFTIALAFAVFYFDQYCIAIIDQGFLWIDDLTRQDAFYKFAEPLYTYNPASMNPEAAQNLSPEQLARYDRHFDTVNLLAIILYSIPWIETLGLYLLGVRQKISWFWTPIKLVLFFIFFYFDSAALLLILIAVVSVRTMDRLRIHKRIKYFNEKHREDMKKAAEAELAKAQEAADASLSQSEKPES